MVVLAAIASAAEPAEEVIVWGRRVEEARAEVVRSLDELGYEATRDRDGRTVFKHPAGWKGKVVLFDDGYLQVRRRGPFLREPPAFPGTGVPAYPLCIVAPTFCVGAGSWYVSDNRWDAVETTVADATVAPLGTLGDALADRSIARTIDVLPLRLEGLWRDGTPLVSDHALPTPAERRAELLAFWDSRTENAWGEQVRALVASFVRAVVEESEQPYTEAERMAFEARRRSSRAFPWDVDSATAAE